jgi:hypothetical protein
LYVLTFAALGIEFGQEDQDILEHYASSGARSKEAVAFFSISGAALSLVVFGNGVRTLISRAGERAEPVAALAWAGTVAAAALILAGNAVSRATAFAAGDKDLRLEPNTWRIFEQTGFLLFVTGTLAAILLVAGVAIAVFRFVLLSRWVGWLSVVTAVLLPLAIVFIGYLVFLVWLVAVSVVLARRPATATGPVE